MTDQVADWTPPAGKPVVTHILRSRLPWETGIDRTECGKDPAEFRRIVFARTPCCGGRKESGRLVLATSSASPVSKRPNAGLPST